jgi:ribose transport system substrate-binding protein
MMKKKVLLATVLLLAAAVFFFTGCGEKPASEPSGVEQVTSDTSGGNQYGPPIDGEIAYVTYYTSVPYWNDGLRGLEAAADSLGIDFDRNRNFYGPADGNGQEQARIIDELVAKGVKGIIVSPADGDAIIGACKNAMNKGIPVVTVISGINDPTAYYGELGGSNYNVGVTGGNYVAGLIGGTGTVGILTIPGVPVHDQRSTGYLETFEKYPNIKVLPLVNTDADPNKGQQRAAALIQANPDLKALIGTDSVGGAAAARAVKEAGKVGEIAVLGMDRDEDLLGYIKEGTVTATVASKSFTTKFLAMHYIYWILNDMIMDVSDWRAAGINPIPRVTDTGNMIIDASNVDIFLNDLKNQ